jgi:hypothetical protein
MLARPKVSFITCQSNIVTRRKSRSESTFPSQSLGPSVADPIAIVFWL